MGERERERESLGKTIFIQHERGKISSKWLIAKTNKKMNGRCEKRGFTVVAAGRPPQKFNHETPKFSGRCLNENERNGDEKIVPKLFSIGTFYAS